jgi:cytochrome c-type biogenesis protein CcmF
VFVALLLLTPAADSTASLILFTLVAFVFAVVGQEFWRGAAARRVMTGEGPTVALARLVGRNRRRYGGYVVHIGIAVMFLGVAASSAFREQSDARILPGQSTKVGDYTVTYLRPTAELGDGRRNTGALLTIGADMRVSKDGRSWTMHPSRNYFGSSSFGDLFEGESTSEVALRWGATRDFWLAVQPDLRAVEQAIKEADAKFAKADPATQRIIIAAIVQRYVNRPVPLPVRAIISPMVVWIWVGGLIALSGALLALWPSRAARHREVASAYKARIGSELTRV